MDSNNSIHVPSSSCFHLPNPNFHQVSQRFIVNLITAIINIATAPVAVTANTLIAMAIFSCSRLRTPSNLLIGCLALSDVLVGLTVQPGYITYRLMENDLRSVPCFVRITYNAAFFICFGVPFMTLSAVSYERFVAVRLRVRYNEFFSSSRVVRYMLGIWLVNLVLTCLTWEKIEKTVRGIHLVLWLICLFLSGATQIGILVIVRRHGKRVQVRFEARKNVQTQLREAKLARSISVIVGIYLILTLPVLFVTLYHQILKLKLQTYNHYSWAETLAFLNSCTNPFICCWRNRQIRQKVKVLLKKILCCTISGSEEGITQR